MHYMIRYIGAIAVWIVLFTCSMFIHSEAGNEITCNDVATIDFNNSQITIEDRGTVHLSNGIGYTSDAGDGGESRDWRITLTQDTTLHPSTSTIVRLLKISASHITGSGAWDYVFIYRCREGHFARILDEKFLYGVRIRIMSDTELLFRSGEWMKGDPIAHPSKIRVSKYKWIPTDGTFMVVESTLYDRPVKE